MQIKTIAITCILLLPYTSSMAAGQGVPLSVEAFAEGGVSFIPDSKVGSACPVISITIGYGCPGYLYFSNAGRLFTGLRLRTGHAAIEASYSYSPNQLPGYYNRLNLFSFNYVQYLSLKSKVQPFATFGLGANRFSGPSTPSTGFDFVGNYGGGTDIVLKKHLALRLELRDYVGGPSRIFIGTSHNIVPSAGIVFRFK